MSTTPGTNLEILQEVGISPRGAVVRAREAHTGQPVLVYPSSADAVISPEPIPPRTVLDARGDVRLLAALLADAARVLAGRHARGEADGQLHTDRILLLAGPGREEVVCVAHPAADGRPRVGATPFTAPEQAVSGAATPAADVWALGVVLYQGLTGCLPFAGSTPLETLHRLVCEPVPRPRDIEPVVPAELEAVCLRCLERAPGLRYQHAGEVAEALDAWLAGRPSSRRSSKGWLLLGGCAGLLVLATLLWRSALYTVPDPGVAEERPPDTRAVEERPPDTRAFAEALRQAEDSLSAGEVLRAREILRANQPPYRAAWPDEMRSRWHRLERLHKAHRFQVEGEVPLGDRQGGWCGFSQRVRYRRAGKWYAFDVWTGRERDLETDRWARAEPLFVPGTEDLKWSNSRNDLPFLRRRPDEGPAWEFQWRRPIAGENDSRVEHTFRFSPDKGPGWEARWWQQDDRSHVSFCRGPLPVAPGSARPFLLQADYALRRGAERWTSAVDSRLARWAEPPARFIEPKREPSPPRPQSSIPPLDAPQGAARFEPPDLPAFVHGPGRHETYLLIAPNGDRLLTVHRAYEGGERHWFNVWLLPGGDERPFDDKLLSRYVR